MPGCLSYIIAKDTEDENVVWITEVWEDEASHHNSLQLPSVRHAITKAMPLIAGFEPGSSPILNTHCERRSHEQCQRVGGVGLPYRKG